MNIKQSSRINQSPFHQLDLKQVDTPLTAVHRKLYQKPYSRNRTQKPSSNKQKQPDHNLKHIRNFNSLKLACIRLCVWNNLRIRAFTSPKQRVYAPSLHWTCVQIYKEQYTLPDIQSLNNPDYQTYRSDERHIKQIKINRDTIIKLKDYDPWIDLVLPLC